MKYLKIFLIPLLIIGYSCNDDSSDLKDRISQLKIENKLLRDSLQNGVYNKVLASELILIPHSLNSNLTSKTTVSGFFYQLEKYPHFDLYYVDEDSQIDTSKKIDYTLKKDYKFEFDFVPKSETDETIRVMAVFDWDTVRAKLPSEIYLPVKK